MFVRSSATVADVQPADSQSSTAQSAFEAEVAGLIVRCLHLEIDPAAIEPDAALFDEGLGLDSIDALELALAISRDYGVELRSDDERNATIFAGLRSLASHIEQHRVR